MNPKTINRSYWTVTGIFGLAMLQSGIAELIPTEGSKEVMTLLGYPMYLLTILGVAKILGVIAIFQPKFVVIKEWAYAGFTIDFLGASASGAFAGGGIAIIIIPLVFWMVMLLLYYLWKKRIWMMKQSPIDD